jgi:hypothetical protein
MVTHMTASRTAVVNQPYVRRGRRFEWGEVGNGDHRIPVGRLVADPAETARAIEMGRSLAGKRDELGLSQEETDMVVTRTLGDALGLNVVLLVTPGPNANVADAKGRAARLGLSMRPGYRR